MAFSLGPTQWHSKRLRTLSPSLPCAKSRCSSHSTIGVLASASLFEMWHNSHAMPMHEWRSQPHLNQVRKINNLNDSSWQWNDSKWVKICPQRSAQAVQTQYMCFLNYQMLCFSGGCNCFMMSHHMSLMKPNQAQAFFHTTGWQLLYILWRKFKF